MNLIKQTRLYDLYATKCCTKMDLFFFQYVGKKNYYCKMFLTISGDKKTVFTCPTLQ